MLCKIHKISAYDVELTESYNTNYIEISSLGVKGNMAAKQLLHKRVVITKYVCVCEG
jgi:hypothetical protein